MLICAQDWFVLVFLVEGLPLTCRQFQEYQPQAPGFDPYSTEPLFVIEWPSIPNIYFRRNGTWTVHILHHGHFPNNFNPTLQFIYTIQS